MTKHVLVLVGSPRGLEVSTSGRYACALTERFELEGWSTESIDLHRAAFLQGEGDEFVSKAGLADLILLVAPLYVDSLPAPTIRALERIAEGRAERDPEAPSTRLAALVHCGFVEPKQNETAIEICRRFASAAGFEWFGGLMLGGGGMPSRRAARALREAGDALARGFPIPPGARKRAGRPMMPSLLYILGGNLMWRRAAKKHGVSKDDLLGAPYS